MQPHQSVPYPFRGFIEEHLWQRAPVDGYQRHAVATKHEGWGNSSV